MTMKYIAGLLLLINGLGALYGGGNFIAHPDGSTMGLSRGVLEFSPFPDFLIPGIVLFIANGVFSIVVLVLMLAGYKWYYWLISAQGYVLVGWIAIQTMLIKSFDPLHIVFGVIGLVLIFCGIGLMASRKRKHHTAAK